MLTLLSQVPMPDKMPDSAGAAIIYICVALILAGVGMGGLFSKWMLKHVNELRDDAKATLTIFTQETAKNREAFQQESEENRKAHAANLKEVLVSSQSQQEKALASFDRHIDRLSVAIEGKLKNDRRANPA